MASHACEGRLYPDRRLWLSHHITNPNPNPKSILPCPQSPPPYPIALLHLHFFSLLPKQPLCPSFASLPRSPPQELWSSAIAPHLSPPHRTMCLPEGLTVAEPALGTPEFCRYHHTVPISSIFCLREALAMLAEQVSWAQGQLSWAMPVLHQGLRSRGCPAVGGGMGHSGRGHLFCAARAWRTRGSSTGLSTPACARGCRIWGWSSS